MAKLPTIASKVYPYYMPINGEDTIVHGDTGLLAETSEEWDTALDTLISDIDKRISIGENAYNYVSEKLQWKTHAEAYKNIVSSIFDAYSKKKV
jgi:glycosyltransferase involved in cell wall biosynthesis